MSVTPGSPRWNELVRECKNADRLTIGKATLEIVPMGAPGSAKSGNVQVLLREFAREIGKLPKTVSMYRYLYAKSQSTSSPTSSPTSQPIPEKRRDELAELAGIRDQGAETRYAAMLNCPPGAVNRPLLDRLEKITEALGDLVELKPEDAVTMIPETRYREFCDSGRAEWLSRFTELCEEYRARETPDLKPLRRWSKPAMNNPVLRSAGLIPAEELLRLDSGLRAALDWLYANGPGTKAMIAVGIKTRDRSFTSRLMSYGLVIKAGQERGIVLYDLSDLARKLLEQ
jgi:hypothetical protein